MNETSRYSPYLVALLVSCVAQTNTSAQSPTIIPSQNVQVMLIKNSLTALNHATISGNYTVLRDLASENFRQRHKAADLSKVFQHLRTNKIDLSPVLVQNPRLVQAPTVSRDGRRLRLKGTFPTQPLAVNFDLIFQKDSNGWSIDEIGLSLADGSRVSQASHQQPAKPQRVNNSYRGPSPTGRPSYDGSASRASYQQPVETSRGYNSSNRSATERIPLPFAPRRP